MLLGDRETQAGRSVIGAPREYRKAFVAAAPRFSEHAVERGFILEPLVFPEG